MKEKIFSYLKWCLRVSFLLAVVVVFAVFSGAFTSVWHKCIIPGAFAAYALILLAKWGVVEWLQVRGGRLVSELASCDFCLSWWACLFFGFVGYAVNGGLDWVAAAFVSTLVCRILK